MNKIWTIIKREYLTRVKSKLFLISTFLMPLGMAALFVIPAISASHVEKVNFTVYVQDNSGQILTRLNSNTQFKFEPAAPGVTKLTAAELFSENEALLIIPEDLRQPVFNIWAQKQLNLQTKSSLENKLDQAFHQYHLEQANIDPEVLREANSHRLSLDAKPFVEDGEVTASTEVASAVGYVLGFLIYIMLLVYGVMVMRGVMEEKTNRIVEVIVSSVRPFQLMLGKILGIGAVGLTQIILWGLLTTVGVGVVLAVIGAPDPGALAEAQAQAPQYDQAQMQAIIEESISVFTLGNILLFLFYFLGGYLIYGSLFAAVGAAVDTQEDSQQLTFPVMLPLIIPTLFMGNILQNPNGGIAKFFSMFPLFSPMVMMMRKVSTEVPWWELLISVVGVIVGFVGVVWLAARIYRIGILMYGKKIRLKEMLKWVWQ